MEHQGLTQHNQVDLEKETEMFDLFQFRQKNALSQCTTIMSIILQTYAYLLFLMLQGPLKQ